MKIDVPIRAITIKDENSGEERTIKTLRSVDEIADELEEDEKDIVRYKVQVKVWEALGRS